MTPEMLDRLTAFREDALERDIPAADVERWTGTARPCAALASGGDGAVVGRFGGAAALPAGVPTPWFPLVASIDCAALPRDATDLPLPPDGRLLLFAFPDIDDCGSMGDVVYVPAGAAVEERERNPYFYSDIDEYRDICQAFPQNELRLTADVSLPYHCAVEIPEPPYSQPLPGHPHSEQLCGVWSDLGSGFAVGEELQIGGYATEECVYLDPVVTAAQLAAGESCAAEEWVLLADWHPGIPGREGSTVHWVIRRDDLAARRFDRAHVSVFWNP